MIKQQNLEAATEAAHWLARIYLSKGDSDQAIKVTRDQSNRGLEGDFSISVQLDLAEALANDPKTVEDSLVLFEKIYRTAPRDRLAPRALYNAAFSALQIGQPEKALKLAGEFIRVFPKDTLVSDIRFVAAEAQLATGEGELAADTYRYLLASSEKDNVQRPMWVLRAAAASNAAKQWDQTISMLGSEIARLPKSAEKSEAYQLIGQAHLQADRPNDAIDALRKSFREESSGPGSERTLLLLGQAFLAADKASDAEKTWQQLVDNASSPIIANQARYRVAQAAAAASRFDQAIRFYDQILKQDPDPQLLPYIQYGKGWAHLQLKQYKTAFDPLDRMLKANADHPLRGDATLARGITLRNLGQLKDAQKDLQNYLSSRPDGINLGHSLYELALIDQQSKEPGEAATKLERLVRDVPDYPSMDQVLYELGWSLQESGDAKRAIQYFDKLIKDYPDNALVAEAAYFIGQQYYAAENWKSATDYFAIAAQKQGDPVLNEKSYYRLGWSYYNLGEFDQSEKSFATQARQHPQGSFAFDAMAMVGESRFKLKDYQGALTAYDASRRWVRTKNETSTSLRDQAERQIRELAFLHGGQSAAQLKQWDQAIGWYDELRKRFPTTAYLPQVFYETGFAYQQDGNTNDALKFFGEVADNYRNELAARARFMMGEIYFANKEFDKAIPEFQRVMFGFGAEKAPDRIKNWQAKSGFEAARCSELLMQSAKTSTAKEKSRKLAKDFFTYVIEKHPRHELAKNSRQLLEGLER
ncbi:MAG: tetratricopeptide repeat protein [Planctomycetota bacterium]